MCSIPDQDKNVDSLSVLNMGSDEVSLEYSSVAPLDVQNNFEKKF